MTEKEKMIAGMLYDSGEAELLELRRFAQKSCEVYNSISATERSERRTFMQRFLGSTGEKVTIESSFKCDYGFNIHVGEGFYSNYDLVILDVCEVKIGKNCMIGPRVSIITATHPLDAYERISGVEYGKPVILGNHVWIGANAVINPGVTLGDNVVVASGAVVTKSFGDNVLIGGVPAKVMKKLVPGVTPGTKWD
jgi:maltose O-acetyltransferase